MGFGIIILIQHQVQSRKQMNKMEENVVGPQTYSSFDYWQKADNFYYPFLNSYIFPFNVNKSQTTFLANTYPAVHMRADIKPLVENPSGQTEIDTLPPVKQEEPIEAHQMHKKQKIIVKDRNILSNNTNLILSLIRRPSKSHAKVTKIISQLNTELRSEYSAKRFYSYQNYIKQNVNDYRNKNAIQVIISHCDLACQIFTISEQLFYNQVCRILIRQYICNTLLLDVLILKKIKKTSRDDHLKVHRYLTHVLHGAKHAHLAALYKL